MEKAERERQEATEMAEKMARWEEWVSVRASVGEGAAKPFKASCPSHSTNDEETGELWVECYCRKQARLRLSEEGDEEGEMRLSSQVRWVDRGKSNEITRSTCSKMLDIYRDVCYQYCRQWLVIIIIDS